MDPAFDPRVTPARGDIAAAHLEGQVEATRFVQGSVHQAAVPVASLRRRPSADAMQETQLLFGETFTIYDIADGWAWGQADLDGYVGYVEASGLAAPPTTATHRISVPSTIVFPTADLKSAPVAFLSMNARVNVEGKSGRFAKIARLGWVFEGHIAPISSKVKDWVAAAESFLGAPYLWGGRESRGLDCSGLIQTALAAAGVEAPRDTDMMERDLGSAVPNGDGMANLQRGDLIFWKGHMGVMLDEARMLHANAHHMATAIEPVREAEARIRQVAGPIRAVKRF